MATPARSWIMEMAFTECTGRPDEGAWVHEPAVPSHGGPAEYGFEPYGDEEPGARPAGVVYPGVWLPGVGVAFGSGAGCAGESD